MPNTVLTLSYRGGIAEEHTLDLYDASKTYYGLSRVVSLVGHYYATGKIISKAPASKVHAHMYLSEEGSVKQSIGVAILAAGLTPVVGVPMDRFMNRVMDQWLPETGSQTEIVELLKEQNQLLRLKKGLPVDETEEELEEEAEVQEFIVGHQTEIDVLRNITANSFKDVFRPVGRSADHISLSFGPYERPLRVMDEEAVALIEAERLDPQEVIVEGVVNSFSRSSKSGIIFSEGWGRGYRFEYRIAGGIPRGDHFSWSLNTGNPIKLKGRFVYWFDDTVKRLLVDEVGLIEPDPDRR